MSYIQDIPDNTAVKVTEESSYDSGFDTSAVYYVVEFDYSDNSYLLTTNSNYDAATDFDTRWAFARDIVLAEEKRHKFAVGDWVEVVEDYPKGADLRTGNRVRVQTLAGVDWTGPGYWVSSAPGQADYPKHNDGWFVRENQVKASLNNPYTPVVGALVIFEGAEHSVLSFHDNWVWLLVKDGVGSGNLAPINRVIPVGWVKNETYIRIGGLGTEYKATHVDDEGDVVLVSNDWSGAKFVARVGERKDFLVARS